jgi:hypothetical protein
MTRPIEIEVVDNLLEIETTLAAVTKLASTVRFYQDEEEQWRWQATLASGDTFGAPLYLGTENSGQIARDILGQIAITVRQGRVKRMIP